MQSGSHYRSPPKVGHSTVALSYASFEPKLYSVYHYTSIRSVVGALEAPRHTIWNYLQVNPRTFQTSAGDHKPQVLARVPILRRAMPKRETRSEDTSLFSSRSSQRNAALGRVGQRTLFSRPHGAAPLGRVWQRTSLSRPQRLSQTSCAASCAATCAEMTDRSHTSGMADGSHTSYLTSLGDRSHASSTWPMEGTHLT